MTRENWEAMTERLAFAWERLNRYEWDAGLLGEMPENISKTDACRNAMMAIEAIIGDANISRFHHVFTLGKTEEEWFRWYTVDRYKRHEQAQEKKRKRKRIFIPAALVSILLTILFHVLRHLSGL